MLLVISIENKNTKFGIYKADKLIHKFKIKTDIEASSDQLGILYKLLMEEGQIKISSIKEVIISSVVPDMTAKTKSIIKKYCKIDPTIVGVGIKTGIDIKCENPKQVGSDRIVNSVAAIKKYGKNNIIINSGSVFTIDLVNQKAQFLGGLIIPGIKTSKEALRRENSKLPSFDIVESQKIIGKSTILAMQAGLYYHYLTSIDQIIDQIKKEEKLQDQDLNIIISGEFSNLLAKNSKHKIIIDENLTLDGLKIIGQINK